MADSTDLELAPPKAIEEREPQFKYEHLQQDLDKIVTQTRVTCLCPSEKIIALGTAKGTVHVLDYSGNEIRCFSSHTSSVNDLSFDRLAEYIGSCADDGSVSVVNLYTGASSSMSYKKPVKTIALDPQYGSRKTNCYAHGGAAGQLLLSSMGWLARTETVIHSGPSVVQVVRWWEQLMVWATESGVVSVYDTLSSSIIWRKMRPRGGPLAHRSSVNLLISGTRSAGILLVCYADALRVLRLSAVANSVGGWTYMTVLVAEMVLSDCLIMGASPLGPDLAVLAYPIHANNQGLAPEDTEAQVQDPGIAGIPPGQRPELRVITLDGEVVARDAMPIKDPSLWTYRDFHLLPSLSRQSDESERKPSPSGSVAPSLGMASSQPSFSNLHAHLITMNQSQPSMDQPSPSEPGPSTPWEPPPSGGPPSRLSRRTESSASLAGGSENGTARPALPGEGREFLFFIQGPEEIVVAGPRDAADRIAWLLERARYEEALEVIDEAGPSAPSGARGKVVGAMLERWAVRGKWAEAAEQAQRLLVGNAAMWERWVYTFAQHSSLPLLARCLPTSSPRLRSTAYDMALSSLLTHPADHELLLELVKTWSADLYSLNLLVDGVIVRMDRPGGKTRHLWSLLAYLYQQQGRPDLSLNIHLRHLPSPEVFPFIREHRLEGLLGGRAADLIEIDEGAALALLVSHADVVQPNNVVACLRDAQRNAANAEGAELWLRRIYKYLQALFEVDVTAAAEFHEMQVGLTARYAPEKLMSLLVSSHYYGLEDALAICEKQGLVPEQVYVLGRMGSTQAALRLIIDKLGDIPQAIEFVRSQGDEGLWEDLIQWALGSPATTASLLDHVGGHINPLLIIRRIPPAMAIPGLRDRLRCIIAHFRTQTSLRQGANAILAADCTHLIKTLEQRARQALPSVCLHRNLPAQGNGEWVRYNGITGSSQVVPPQDVPTLPHSEPLPSDPTTTAPLALLPRPYVIQVWDRKLPSTNQDTASTNPFSSPPKSYAAAVNRSPNPHSSRTSSSKAGQSLYGSLEHTKGLSLTPDCVGWGTLKWGFASESSADDSSQGSTVWVGYPTHNHAINGIGRTTEEEETGNIVGSRMSSKKVWKGSSGPQTASKFDVPNFLPSLLHVSG